MERRNKNLLGFTVNSLLIVFGIETMLTGYVLQIGFHIGNEGRQPQRTEQVEQLRQIDPTQTVWNIDYTTWTVLHKVVIVILLLLMVYHLVTHWKWYVGVFSKHVAHKNKLMVTLTVLFLLVTFTGIIPWAINIISCGAQSRFFLIELHDRLAIFLTVFLLWHIIKKLQWYVNTYRKLKNERS